jgi:hypothetical protein
MRIQEAKKHTAPMDLYADPEQLSGYFQEEKNQKLVKNHKKLTSYHPFCGGLFGFGIGIYVVHRHFEGCCLKQLLPPRPTVLHSLLLHTIRCGSKAVTTTIKSREKMFKKRH